MNARGLLNGVAQGEPFVLSLAGRGLRLLPFIPGPTFFPPFSLPSSVLEWSLTIIADGNGYLGWIAYEFPSSGKLVTAPIGLNENDRALLTRANAP